MSSPSSTRTPMSGAVRAFSIIVGLGGALAAATLPLTGVRESLGTFALLAALSVVAGSMSVFIPRSKVAITPGDAFVFAALFAVGPFAGPLVAVAGALGTIVRRRQPAIRMIFNLGTLSLSAAAAGWTQLALLGAVSGPAGSLLALFGAVGAFFLVNTLLVAIVLRLHTGAPILRTWCQSGLWTATSSATNGLLALGLASVVAAVGPLGFALGLVGCASIAASYRARRQATAESADAETAEALRSLEQAVDHVADGSEPIADPSYLPPVERDPATAEADAP